MSLDFACSLGCILCSGDGTSAMVGLGSDLCHHPPSPSLDSIHVLVDSILIMSCITCIFLFFSVTGGFFLHPLYSLGFVPAFFMCFSWFFWGWKFSEVTGGEGNRVDCASLKSSHG